MAPTPVLSGSDGPQITVNQLADNPYAIPALVLSLLSNGYVSETILRNAGPNANGLVSFSESTPLFLDDDLEAIAEFGEIPVGKGQIGLPRIVAAIKKGRGIRVSKEMRDENQVDLVNTQIKQLVNTAIRNEERALRALLSNPAIPTIPAVAAWDTSASRPRRDLANAQEVIASATPYATANDDVFGFNADTVVMANSLTPVLIDNDNFLAVYKDSLAASSIAYTGKLERQILGMDGLQSRSFPTDRVLVVERGTVGFYSDTRTRDMTPLYPEGGGPNGGPTETWRADLVGKRALGVDQPKAACWITGVRSV